MRLELFDKSGPRRSLAFHHSVDERWKAERRVLIVDDSRDAALMLATLLKAMGYTTTSMAHDGHSALKIAREQRSQVALIDLVMPDMDGFELAYRLRGIEGLGEMRLIALTGFADEISVRYAKDAKFDGLIAKPASRHELESVLEA